MDVGEMNEVAQEPATLAKALETIPGGVDPVAYKCCLEYCQVQGVNLDTLKFIGTSYYAEEARTKVVKVH